MEYECEFEPNPVSLHLRLCDGVLHVKSEAPSVAAVVVFQCLECELCDVFDPIVISAVGYSFSLCLHRGIGDVGDDDVDMARSQLHRTNRQWQAADGAALVSDWGGVCDEAALAYFAIELVFKLGVCQCHEQDVILHVVQLSSVS